ncbi:hypothetical protein [Mycobacteroides abscessus]|uniref:hypothetical protein n=1 Tax=Mycobacteroides abscessus TaxID=36809 RepID=UPI001F17E4B2|nr:hypothetical protein [Mycobacteroides abscessus]
MSVIHYPAVPYERLKRQQLLTLAYVLEEQRDRALKKVEQIPELVAEVERLQAESAHWKSLWQGTVEYPTKVIQERDEALREVERLEKRAIPETVTRIDMIDPKRHEHWSDYWSVSIQDEGRTLKLFAEGDGSAAREERDAALARTISEDLRRLGGSDE